MPIIAKGFNFDRISIFVKVSIVDVFIGTVVWLKKFAFNKVQSSVPFIEDVEVCILAASFQRNSRFVFENELANFAQLL